MLIITPLLSDLIDYFYLAEYDYFPQANCFILKEKLFTATVTGFHLKKH